MIFLPQMVMIVGISRNSDKRTMACNITKNIAAAHEVIGLNVTNVRPGEEDLQGNHNDEVYVDYMDSEDKMKGSHTDTSKMLAAGAAQVYYIHFVVTFIEQALLHFLSKYINKQILVFESRSLRGIVNPGLFLIMIRLPVETKVKDISEYFTKADKVFNFGEVFGAIIQFAESLQFVNTKFDWSH